MPTAPKTLLSKISKEHRIRFNNNHNHVMLIIQKVVTGYHTKINLAASASVPLFVLQLQYEPPEISETVNIGTLMANSF